MALDRQTEMSPAEIDAVLSRHESGVISLARGSDPYAIPISYGYDSTERTVYYRLVSTPESAKRRFLTSDPEVRLVVHEEEDPVYRSIIASGTMAEIDPESLSVEYIEQYGQTKRPLFEIWRDAKRDLDIQLFELDPDELSGRCLDVDEAASVDH